MKKKSIKKSKVNEISKINSKQNNDLILFAMDFCFKLSTASLISSKSSLSFFINAAKFFLNNDSIIFKIYGRNSKQSKSPDKK